MELTKAPQASAIRSTRLLDAIVRFRRPIVVLVHVVLITASNLGAFWLRFDGDIPPLYAAMALQMLPWLIAIRILTLWPLRLFEGLWKYTSIWDLRNITIAVMASTLMFLAIDIAWNDSARYPRSIYIIDSILLICSMSAVRLSRRMYKEWVRPSRGRRVLIYGAGDAGEMIVRDMRQNASFDAEPIGFIDDDSHKVGQRIHGVPVLGTGRALPEILRVQSPDEVLIAMPSAPRETLRGVVRALERYKVRISTLPRLTDVVDRRIAVDQIRQLKVEDLLARAPVGLASEPVRDFLRGRRVLVTGAGGSIGSELCRQIAEAQPTCLLMLDRYENALFHIHNELAQKHRALLRPIIGDVTDRRRLEQVFREHQPALVFHAAAHKHVPLMEENPCEAIKNNVAGTRLLAETASVAGVDRFVLISTDKAVNPTSVMGAAKRVAELIVRALNQSSGTRFVVVRFGNVLGSNGSVVPHFLSQIEKGGPVTVTHPEMCRYFMLIPEAVQLVLHAAALSNRGSVYVLDMGEQIKVVEMARDLIRLSGLVPDQDIAIEFTGTRPGEKLQEELVGDDEIAEPSPTPKIMQVRSRNSSLERVPFQLAVATLERLAQDGQAELVLDQLCEIVPSFKRVNTPMVL